MKVYKCDICEQYVDDYQHINKGGKGRIKLISANKKEGSFDLCDTCYDFLEAYTSWDTQQRKDIYNYVIDYRRKKVIKQIKPTGGDEK